MIWQIVNARPEHVTPIAASLRKADRREVMASHGHTPEQALQASFEYSALAWTCLVRNEPAIMWGVCPLGGLLGLQGSPWLLGTDAIIEVRRDFLKLNRQYVEEMQSVFPMLWNYVHAENVLSKRWLKWCGFKIAEQPEVYGVNNELFYKFWRNNV